MLSHTSADIAAAIGRHYSPEGFLRQYSEKSGISVALGEGAVEERSGDFFAVSYPLVIGGIPSDNIYVIDARGIYSNDPEILAVSFSGKHPLARDATLVQLIAKRAGIHFVRGNDVLFDIVFPGIELPSEEQELGMQPQPQPERRIAVATRPALPEALVRELEGILRDF